MNCRFVLASLVLLGSWQTKPSYSSEIKNKGPIFDITAAPSDRDWRLFTAANTTWKQGFWAYHRQQNKVLGDWAWGWRLGWLHSCKEITAAWCQDILMAGLNDRALVVRAQAAEALGLAYAGSADPNAIKLLTLAYERPDNRRHGKPLFILRNILFAMKKIGGDAGLGKAGQLASSEAAMAVYWQKLTKPHKQP